MNEKMSMIIIFYFFGLIYIAETQNSNINILHEHDVTEKEAAAVFYENEPYTALPLVLYADGENQPQFPNELEQVVTKEGRMLEGTKFLLSGANSEQMFFCPEDNSKASCVVREHFKDSEHLKCTSELIPTIEPMSGACAGNINAHFYRTQYKICNSEKYPFISKEIPFYLVCYDEENKKSVFSSHQIRSPKLLNSKLLFKERSTLYDMRDDLKIIKSELSEGSGKSAQTELGSSLHQDIMWAAYVAQKLVPAEDMALGSWRKITFQRVNTALQHELLIDIWNEIEKHIRYKAVLEFAINESHAIVSTGVFNIHLAPNDYQLSNIWVKMVYFGAKEIDHGIAILMNNFLTIDIDDSEDLKLRAKAIETFCDENLCAQYLKDKFQQIQGDVRCCPVNQKILDLFGQGENIIPKVSDIVNVTTDQEILNNQEITDEQAAYSIGEIQRNEVLPLVSISIRPKDMPRVPKDINHVQTLNRRIASGTQFSFSKYTTSIFYCPRESANAKCLDPVEFNAPKPLQCNKEAVPVVKKQQTSSNTCGVGHTGTQYKIVYEICQQSRPYRNYGREIKIFDFCHDMNSRKIQYVHHSISPKLLFSKLLFRERTVEYPITMDYGLPLSNYQELKDAASALTFQETEEQESPNSTKKSVYKLQHLVPADDMAFALWRKPTFRYANFELQHEKLIPLWNDMNAYVRNHVNEWSSEQTDAVMLNVEYRIYTGVFDVMAAPNGDTDNQKSNIWVKIIYREASEPYRRGLVILMNNFLLTETDQDDSLNFKANALNTYCAENICTTNFRRKFEKIGGQIRCCPITTQILQLFGELDKPIDIFDLQPMDISNITK